MFMNKGMMTEEVVDSFVGLACKGRFKEPCDVKCKSSGRQGSRGL
jgi:hypothetical protein